MKQWIKKSIRFVIIVVFMLIVGEILVEQTDLTWQPIMIGVFLLFIIRILGRLSKKKRMLNSSLAKIDQMSGVEFEEYLMYQFKKQGYHVKLTPLSGDFGADLILKKFRKEYIVQAKRYSGAVGIKAVQEVLGAKEYYGIDNVLVVTNNYYTKAAKELAEVSGVDLWDRKQLVAEFGIKK